MANVSSLSDSRAMLCGMVSHARGLESTMPDLYILFHVPTRMFADEYGRGANGNRLTCGLAYAHVETAENARRALEYIGCNIRDWIVTRKPHDVTVDWVDDSAP